MNKPDLHVPGDAEWAGYEVDLDARYAHGLLYGKTIEQAQELFGQNLSIERADELQFVPRRVFQYYVFAFAECLRTDRARGDSDSASPFLHLLLERERIDRGSVSEIYRDLAPTIDFVAANQQHFDADEGIYGSFAELAREICRMCCPDDPSGRASLAGDRNLPAVDATSDRGE